MKVVRVLVITSVLVLISGCQSREPVCPPESISYVSNVAQLAVLPPQLDAGSFPTQMEVEINGKTMLVDQIIQGPLCIGDWSGTVYVGCELQIAAWEDEAGFLEECDLNIEPGTVVYVAAHDDEPYYKGCSCHTGEDPIE
jgi:hypothetical protein